MAESGFVKVAAVGELSPGDMKSVEVGNDQILLINHEGNIYACDDICSHAYAVLSEGDISGDEIECPLHGSAFNYITGEVLTPPADENLRTFEIRIDGDDILVGPAKG